MKPKITFKQPFGYDYDEASDEATVGDPGLSMTIQSHSEDADINVMMKRFGVMEAIPQTTKVPTYGDFSDITDYRSALAAAKDAETQFMALPAPLRAAFDNDPQNLLEFASIPENIPKLIEMGLGKEIVYGTREPIGGTGPNPAPGANSAPAGAVGEGNPAPAGGGKAAAGT